MGRFERQHLLLVGEDFLYLNQGGSRPGSDNQFFRFIIDHPPVCPEGQRLAHGCPAKESLALPADQIQRGFIGHGCGHRLLQFRAAVSLGFHLAAGARWLGAVRVSFPRLRYSEQCRG